MEKEKNNEIVFDEFEKRLVDVCKGWHGEDPGYKEYIRKNADYLKQAKPMVIFGKKVIRVVNDEPWGCNGCALTNECVFNVVSKGCVLPPCYDPTSSNDPTLSNDWRYKYVEI